MRGADYFPDEGHGQWAAHYDRKLRDWQLRQQRGDVPRNFAVNPVTQVEYNAIYLAIEPEYREWLRVNDQEQQRLWNVPELDVNALPEREFDRPRLEPFKLEYDTLAEVQMRFRQTVIQIKGNPFYVSDVRADRARRAQYMFLLEDPADRKAFVGLDKLSDMRSTPPGFVQLDGYAGWFARSPARVNQQGLNPQNTTLRRVSDNEHIPLNLKTMLKALDSKGKTTKWCHQYRDLMQNGVLREMRLSDEVALFGKKDEIYVAYRGRVFGKLNDNLVTALDEDDLIQPWIGKHFRKVELEVRNA